MEILHGGATVWNGEGKRRQTRLNDLFCYLSLNFPLMSYLSLGISLPLRLHQMRVWVHNRTLARLTLRGWYGRAVLVWYNRHLDVGDGAYLCIAPVSRKWEGHTYSSCLLFQEVFFLFLSFWQAPSSTPDRFFGGWKGACSDTGFPYGPFVIGHSGPPNGPTVVSQPNLYSVYRGFAVPYLQTEVR